MRKPNGINDEDKSGVSQIPMPSTPWGVAIALLWYPPWRRWLILVPLVIIIAVVNVEGKEQLLATFKDKILGTSEENMCWNRIPTPSDIHVTGMRVIERSTIFDLTGWKEVTPNELASKVPVEQAVSRNKFIIERTNNKDCFMTRVSTTSGIDPTIHCKRCKIIAVPYSGELPLKEWDILFDIQNQPIEQAFPIQYSVDFWNSSQRPDQWWGGFRILYSTEKANYSVIFPEEKKPNISNLQYRFARSSSQKTELMTVDPKNLKIRQREGLVEQVDWTVTNPQPDRSYRIYWTW